MCSTGFSRTPAICAKRNGLPSTFPALPFCYVHLKAPKPVHSKYPQVINTLGDHLRKKRLELGLPQRQVAKQMGVDPTTLCHWETNQIAPSTGMIPRIIRFLGY